MAISKHGSELPECLPGGLWNIEEFWPPTYTKKLL